MNAAFMWFSGTGTTVFSKSPAVKIHIILIWGKNMETSATNEKSADLLFYCLNMSF